MPVPRQMNTDKNTRTSGPVPQIVIWDDFILANLNDSYGHVLDLRIPDQQLEGAQAAYSSAGHIIAKADDTRHLIRRNDELLRLTLQPAKSHLSLYPGTALLQVYTTEDGSVLAKFPNAPQKPIVDHVIALDDFPRRNLVVGLGKPSAMWSGVRLALQLDAGPNSLKAEMMWPVRQLARLYKLARTRYGYLQTSEELVVSRFSATGEQ